MRHRDPNLSKDTQVVSGRFRCRKRGGKAGRVVGMEKEITWEQNRLISVLVTPDVGVGGQTISKKYSTHSANTMEKDKAGKGCNSKRAGGTSRRTLQERLEGGEEQATWSSEKRV